MRNMLVVVLCVFLALIFPVGAYGTISANHPGCCTFNQPAYYAILVCGSNDFNLGFETDMRDMYSLVIQELKYNVNDTYYVAPANWDGATHYYPLSQDNIKKAISDVANRINDEDSLFLYYTAHGGFQSLDGDGDKKVGEQEDVSAIELDSWLDGIQVKQTIILLQGCKTGSFIDTLSQSMRAVITATDSLTSSWEDMSGVGDPGWDPNAPDDDGASNPQNRNWDGSEFSSGFRMAYRDIDSDGYKEADDGTYINYPGKKSDKNPLIGNQDGRVTVLESFNFAEFEDYCSPYWSSFIQAKGWLCEYPQIRFCDLNQSQVFVYNNQPEKPAKPTGPTSGEAQQVYSYSSYTNDPDKDQLYYQFEWGDGNTSGWIGPFPSGQIINTTHSWSEMGNYSVKVKAKDIFGSESFWSDILVVSMPKTCENPFQHFIEKVFEWFFSTIFKINI